MKCLKMAEIYSAFDYPIKQSLKFAPSSKNLNPDRVTRDARKYINTHQIHGAFTSLVL